MSDIRTAIVGFAAVVIGFAGAWMVFGGRAAKLERENIVLRQQQRGQLTQQLNETPADPSKQLIGKWATTVAKSRLGRAELIFELRDDGSVVWRSVQEQKFTEIAVGTWTLDGDQLSFVVTIVDDRSADKGQQKTTVARIKELSSSCLSLEVEGDEWAFHRTTT